MLRHPPGAWAVAALVALAAVAQAEAATYVNRDYYTDSQGRQQYNLVERHYSTSVAWNAADGPFIVERNVVVDATGTVTVGNGAAVQFSDDLALYVLGTLNATGATFTSSRPQPEPGAWRGICFVSPGQASSLTNCTVSYGGSGAWDGGRYLRGSLTFHDAGARVTGCTLSYSKYDGVTCYGTSVPTLDGNRFSNNGECAVYLDSLACRPVLSGSTVVGNGWRGVYVRPGGDFASDLTFYADLPYVVAETVNVPAGVTATIQEGAVLKFRGDRAFYVAGRLVANGSPQRRIVFSSAADDTAGGDTNSDGASTTPAPGDWRCLCFYNEGSGTLASCDVRYAGNGAWDGGRYQNANLSTFSSGDLSLSDCRLTDAKHYAALFGGKSAPRVARCTFSRSEWGIVANEDAYLSVPAERRITGCSITANSLGAASMKADQVNALAPDNVLAGSVVNSIEVYGTMRWSANWDNQSPGAFYRVVDFVSVANGISLTVAPKVVVRMAPDRGIYVGGTLIADGVTFTSDREQPSPGDWRSICFTSDQKGSRLTNCTIQYGGNGAWDGVRYNNGNLTLHDSGTVTASNCTIAFAKWDGVKCYGDATPVLSGNTFAGNLSTAVFLDSLASKPVMSGSQASGNGWNGVYVRPGGDLPGETTFYADLPYVLAGDINVPEGGTLTIKPGAVVKFCENRALYIAGSLNAVGSAGKGIAFTSWRDDVYGGDTNACEGDVSPGPSDWRCLAFVGSGSGTLTFCNIAYGGNGSWDSARYQYGNVGVFTSGAVALRDCRLRGGANYGLYVTSGAPEVSRTSITGYRWGIVTAESAYAPAVGQRLISSCAIYGNREGGASMLADQADQIAPSTFIYANTPNRVDVSGTLRWRTRWDNPSPGLFYRVTDHVFVPKGLALDVGPRTTVRFEGDKGLYVDGTLLADSSVFTSAQAMPTPGYWRGMCFTSNQTGSSLTNCTVEYGGNGAWDSARYNHGNLTLDNAGQVTVTKCTISNARYDGVKCYNANTPIITGTTFAGNLSTAVAMDGLGSLPVLAGNSATGNGWNGIYVIGEGSLPPNAVLYADIPYLFTRTVSVPEGGYLEVQPGAVIKFGAGCGLYVAGSMAANGTPAKRITFTSWRDDTAGGDTNQVEGSIAPEPGNWRALVLQNTGAVSLSFADIRYGGDGAWDNAHYNHGGIQVVGSASPTISYCTVARSRYDGIKTWDQARPYIRNVTVYDCLSVGLVTENASAPTVLNSIFAFNNTGVLTLRDSKPVITYSNTFGNRESSCQTEELVNGNWQRVQRSAIPGDTNMVKDPMFVDAPLLNLRLAAGSPMIDAGDPSTYDPVDTRSRADLGAMPAAEGQIAAADRVPPTVVATTPLAGSYGAPLSGPITATFDEAINPATVTDRSFTLADASGNHVPGVVAYNQATKTASFTPAAPLAAGALYSASVGAAVQDLAGNALPVPFMWSFATSGGAAAPGAQPDLALRTAEESGFAGVGVYASVEGQTKAQAVRYGSPAVYHVRVTNAGSAAQTVELLGAAGDEQWTVDYYDALSGGNKITADVTGSSGWLTRTLAPGDSVMVRAEVTPAITAPGGSSKDVFVAAIASSAPGFRDICRLVTTSLPVSKVNAMIRSADDVNYTGGDLYNATAEGQRDVQAADAGATVVYHVQAVNEGNAAYALTLSGPGSGDGWSIRYFDALVGGTEISKVVASGGYVSPALAPGRAVEIRVEVTPSSAVPEGSTKDVVISVSPGADRNAVDAVCASVLVTAPKAVAVGGTYTLDQEFDLGVLAGVEHTSVHDQLQLSKEAVTLPFIWVPNSNEGTVSKVDTRTGRELGRYRVSPQANSSPSRTTVDLQGNCWVANRLTGTVVKIGLLENGQYVDRNGDGIIQTSRDLNGDGDITIDEVLPWGQDECVLVETIVIPGKEGAYVPGTYTGEYANNDQNPGPRGIAVDRGNNVWIGTHDSRMFYYLDGATGRILRSIDVSSVDHTSYGAVIDGQGILWSSGIDKNHVLRLDPATGQFSVVPVGHTVYGLGLDRANHLFIAGWQSSKLTCINVLTGQKEWTRDGIYESRGVAVTSDGDVWVANSGPGTVARWSPDGVFKAQIPVGSQPTGVSVDASGKVWAVNLGDESIERIDPLTNTVDLRKTIKGASHYGYSDMTGMVSRTVTTRTGTWTVVHDGRAVGAKWASVSWHAATPDGTSVSVAVRSSDDRRGWSDWEAVASGARLNSTPNGRYLQVRVTLQASASGSSPVLYDLTVVPADTTPPQVVSVVPAPGTIGVLPTTSVSASFSEAMDPASISASTFVLVDQRGVAVPATVQYDANRYVAVLQPAVPLAYSTAYTARISQGATDLAGNQLATAAVWGFTTAPAPDTVPPTVVATVPANGAVSAPADKPITITFSEPLDPRTVTDAAISLVNWSGGAVVAYDQASKTVTLTPGAKLWYNTTYTVIVRPVLTDLAGNVMAAPYTWSFTTAPAVDTVPPEVTSTTPAKDARDVPADAAIAATFSEPVKADTLTTSTFTLQDASGGPVAGSVTYDDKKRTATLKPGGKLSAGAVYTATLTAGVTDEAGNALASYSWSFTVAKETPSVLVGDLNGDGRVGISDATIALRIAVGLRVPTSSELAAGDLNGDGRISIAEVTRVLRIALGL